VSIYLEDREREIFNKQAYLLATSRVDRPLIFDVGANRGQSIVRYRELFKNCHIHSFEPIPHIFDILRQSWGDAEDVQLHSFALASKNECRPFHIMRIPEMSSLLAPEPWLQKLSPNKKYDFDLINVECRTLDEICHDFRIENIDVLKIDVQGAELDVLKGGTSLLEAGLIGLIYLEVTLADSYVNQMKLRDLLEFLEPNGYKLWDILPFVYTDAERAWTANAIFVNSKIAKEVELTSRRQKRL